ncbi:7937_t:CDS:2, partial [Cetraspora pellucida]
YADNESTSSRICPDYKTDSQWFRIQLRKTGFLNPNEKNRSFESLEKLSSKKLLVSYPISDTVDEEQMQSEESSMKKEELIVVI